MTTSERDDFTSLRELASGRKRENVDGNALLGADAAAEGPTSRILVENEQMAFLDYPLGRGRPAGLFVVDARTQVCKARFRKGHRLCERRDAMMTMQPIEALAELAVAAKYMRGLRRHEYEQLVANGTFESERVELLEGMIVHMSPHGPLHDGTLDLLLDQFTVLAGKVRLRVQSAFAASDGSEREPALAVVPRGDYRTEHPKAAYLIAEVADSSLERDRSLKSRVYCQSGVPEYWIVNLVDSKIMIFRSVRDGGYESVSTHRAGDTISPIHFPELRIAVSDILSK